MKQNTSIFINSIKASNASTFKKLLYVRIIILTLILFDKKYSK